MKKIFWDNLLWRKSQIEGLNNVENCYEEKRREKQNRIIKTITTTIIVINVPWHERSFRNGSKQKLIKRRKLHQYSHVRLVR
jgi:hypothetical protein